MTEKTSLETMAANWSALLSKAMESIFGPGVHNPVLGSVSWADLGVFAIFLVIVVVAHGLAAALLRRKMGQDKQQPEPHDWRAHLLGALGKPLYLLIWIYGIYLAATPLLLRLPSSDGPHALHLFFGRLLDLGVFAVLVLVFFRLTRVLEARLKSWASKTDSKLDDLVVPLLGRSLRVIVPIVGLIFALPVIGLPQEYAAVIAKGSSILVIGMVAWILFQMVHLGERAVLAKHDITSADNLQARKVYTQVHVLSKTVYVIIAIFTAASILMLFDEVRRFGASLLASAGVIGIIVGFAAQRTIANLFAGFQLAMTQPIRLDDVVVVEDEWGRIEEITLTYVIVHIWDDRRLVVPLSYFIEKPFQNWTRVSADILGSVFLWVDYSLPLEEVRQAVKEIVTTNPLWDKRFWNVQVTDANERAMQIRVLVTTADSSKGWDLRCEIREKLVEFIQKKHPGSLPRLRAEMDGQLFTTPRQSPSTQSPV